MSGRLVRFNKILPGNIVKHDGSNREAVSKKLVWLSFTLNNRFLSSRKSMTFDFIFAKEKSIAHCQVQLGRQAFLALFYNWWLATWLGLMKHPPPPSPFARGNHKWCSDDVKQARWFQYQIGSRHAVSRIGIYPQPPWGWRGVSPDYGGKGLIFPQGCV